MIINEFIDKILGDVGAPLDSSGFWSRSDVLKATDYIQREISRETKNILAVTATLEPAAAATEITIDANNNFLEGVSAYRTYDSLTRPIDFYTSEQMRNYDVGWKTQTGTQIRALITDIASAEGKALIYPIPEDALNDIVVYYLKMATRVTAEFTEAGDAANQVSNWLIQGITSSNTATGYILYWGLANVTTTRTVTLYKAATMLTADKVASGTRTGDGSITLTEQNNSGISGTVTVAYTVDDSTSANTLTFAVTEIPEADIACLEYGVKALMYNLEKDGKDQGKGNFWKGLYGGRTPDGLLTGELAAVAQRANQRRGSTYNILKERGGNYEVITRPLYPWEA